MYSAGAWHIILYSNFPFMPAQGVQLFHTGSAVQIHERFA